MAVTEHAFRAMASSGQVIVVDGSPGLAEGAEAEIGRLESLWSRFLDTSDISRLNRAGGRPTEVASDTIVLVMTMVEAWHLTGGRCDASTLPATLGNGYRVSIDDPSRSTSLPSEARHGADLDRIGIDILGGRITLPRGCALDPGSVGKGLAADLTATWVLDQGAAGALVSIGGDLAAIGTPPEPEGWIVTVEDPFDESACLCTLRVGTGGVATSSTRTRRWVHDGTDRHHLIDPASGQQAVTDLAAVTVLAPTAWQAEAIATGALLGGSETVLGYLDAHDVDGIATTHAGRCESTFADLDAASTTGVPS